MFNAVCHVSEVDLDEKWWYPQDNSYTSVYFRFNGEIIVEGGTDSLTFNVQNCNKIMVMNHTAIDEEQWTIKRITDEELHLLFPDGTLVMYTRKK